MAVKSIRAPGITNNKSQNIETKRQKKTWIGYRNTINCVQRQPVTDNNDNDIVKDKMILRFWLVQIPPLIYISWPASVEQTWTVCDMWYPVKLRQRIVQDAKNADNHCENVEGAVAYNYWFFSLFSA